MRYYSSVVATNNIGSDFFNATQDSNGNPTEQSGLFPNESFEFTFTKVGEYHYVSVSHPWMQGAVVVIDNSSITGSGGNNTSTVECNEYTLCTFQLKAGNSTYPIHFRMNGFIEGIVADLPTKTLIINVKAENSTKLQIAIPREILDARSGIDGKSGSDVDFAVFVDQQNVEAFEYSTGDRHWAEALGIAEHPEKYRILEIPITAGSESVEIVTTMPA